MDPDRDVCGAHGGHKTAELRDVRRAGRGRGVLGGLGTVMDGVSSE